MTDYEVATVGDNCMDRYVGAEPFELVGGNAVNVAVQLARRGRSTAYFGAVGSDTAGRRVVEVLADAGVDTTHIRIEDGVTAYTEIGRGDTGDRTFLREEFGVVATYRPTVAETAILSRARHVHIGWLNDGGALTAELGPSSVTVSQDVSVNADPDNLRVAGLDVSLASHEGQFDEARRLAESYVAAGAKRSIVTRGPKGSLTTDGTSLTELGALAIDPVDTTGAGDAFIAGFIDAQLDALPIKRCMERGRDLATRACLHLGGFEQASGDF